MDVSSLCQLNQQFNPTLNEINKSLRCDKFSIVNRLKSIDDDHGFVERVHSSFFKEYPLCANLRCGSWYVHPMQHCCYFKSTDGHFGEWTFNLRRLNPNVLKLIVKTNGIVIVDSTRKGKVYPDALQRTIPIWCHVLNRIFHILSMAKYENQKVSNDSNPSLKMPPWIIGSEREQIEERAETQWIPALLQSNIVNELKEIQSHFDGECNQCIHLEPFWIDRLSDLKKIQKSIQHRIISEGVLPVILLTASRPIHAVEMIPSHRRSPVQYRMMQEINDFNFEYIQGAGDDEEHWSRGITPEIFWENKCLFLQCHSNEECLELQTAILKEKEEKLDGDKECGSDEIMSMKEVIRTLSSKQIVKETGGRLYVSCDNDSGRIQNINPLDIVKKIENEKQSLSEWIQNVVLCVDDMETVIRCNEYIDSQKEKFKDSGIQIGVYFVVDSKKHKQSLRKALEGILDGLGGNGNVWIYSSDFNVNVIGCVAASIIIDWIRQGILECTGWMGVDSTETDDDGVELNKRKIRSVLERFQFMLGHFHPSRLLMKQINNHFLSL